MSVDEDTELRDLIAQTLEANGCFAKIRAQLRASIYLALDENESLQKKEPMLNNKVKSALRSPDGRIMFCIVRDFLEYYDLNFTLSVYETESNLGTLYDDKRHQSILEDLEIQDLPKDSSSPVLLQLIKFTRSLKIGNLKTINICDCNNKSIISSNQKNVGLDTSRNTFLDQDISDRSDKSQKIMDEQNRNETFEVNSPMFSKPKEINKAEANLSNEVQSENTKEYSDDNSELNLGNKSLAEPDVRSKMTISNMARNMDDQYSSELEISPPVVKDGKYSKFDLSNEKLKLSAQKLEKVRVRNNPSSCGELPPISVTKSRSNEMLLPPLYTKELKEMSSQKELERQFELEPLDNYEEDFMSENEIDLMLNKSDGNLKMQAFENNPLTTIDTVQTFKRYDAENNHEEHVANEENNGISSARVIYN